MADSEEDKKNEAAETPSVEDKPALNKNEEEKAGAASSTPPAAVKAPSTEATQDLLELLGTVGNAGLGPSVELAKADSDEKDSGSKSAGTVTEDRDESAEASISEAANQAPGFQASRKQNDEAAGDFFRGGLYPDGVPSSPLPEKDELEDKQAESDFESESYAGQAFSKLKKLSGKIDDQLGKEHWLRVAPEAISEITDGTLGSATLALFGIGARHDISGELKHAYLEIASLSESCLEDLSPDETEEEIRFRIKGAPPASETQIFSLQIRPASGAELKEQRVLRDRLDLDPLTSRFFPADLEQDPESEFSTSLRAERVNLKIPEAFSPDKLDLLQAPTPTAGMTVASFARSAGMEGDDLNSYFQSLFYKTKNPRLRQEALQGLRDEVLSGRNQPALEILQELIVNKAAIEFREAERRQDDEAVLQALTALAALEDISPAARMILQEYSLSPQEDSYNSSIADHAREAARDLARSSFETARRAYAAFLSRENDKLPPEERQTRRLDCISDLAFAGQQRLYQMARDDFSYLAGTLRSVDALVTIAETNAPEIAAQELGNLMKMQMLGENVSALDYLTKIHNALQNEPGAANLEQIHRSLLQANGREQDALKLLKTCLPDINTELNEYRLAEIIKGLGPESSSSEMRAASKTLEQEEKIYGNSAAAEFLNWTRAGESAARIDEVIKGRNLDELESVKATAETIKTEMEKLSRLALSGNDSARATLVGMLMCGADTDSQNLWRAAQEKGALLPDLTRLSATERSIVREHAALSVEESLKKHPNLNPLKPADATGLAVALAETYSTGDRNVQRAIESTFDTALKCLSRTAAVDGILAAIASDLAGSGKLCELILKAQSFSDGLSNTQRNQLGRLAREGVRGAIRTLAALSASDSPYAPLAASDLVKAGSIVSNRDQVLSIMIEQYKRFSDRHSLLAAMGDIACRDNPARPLVLETIRQAIENSASRPDSQEYKSAQKGLLFLAENWGPKEVQTLRHNLRMEMLAALPSIAEKLSSNTRELLLSSQHEVLLNGSAEERLSAVQAMGALGRYAGPEVAADIGFFIMSQGKAELERAGMSKEKIALFLDFAARALLSIMSSADPKVQEAAFDSFRRQGNWPGMLESSSLRNMVIDYVQGRSQELELNQQAMQLVYDAGLARPLSSTFKDLGVGGDKISTQQLLALADKAATNYATAELDGKAVVHKILSNAATLNALSPGLREKITGCPVGIDMSQLAGQLINGTMDADYPPGNPLFCDLARLLLKEQRELESKAAQMQLEMPEAVFAPDERSSEPEPGIKPLRIGSGKNFCETFNAGNGSQNKNLNEKLRMSRRLMRSG